MPSTTRLPPSTFCRTEFTGAWHAFRWRPSSERAAFPTSLPGCRSISRRPARTFVPQLIHDTDFRLNHRSDTGLQPASLERSVLNELCRLRTVSALPLGPADVWFQPHPSTAAIDTRTIASHRGPQRAHLPSAARSLTRLHAYTPSRRLFPERSLSGSTFPIVPRQLPPSSRTRRTLPPRSLSSSRPPALPRPRIAAHRAACSTIR